MDEGNLEKTEGPNENDSSFADDAAISNNGHLETTDKTNSEAGEIQNADDRGGSLWNNEDGRESFDSVKSLSQQNTPGSEEINGTDKVELDIEQKQPKKEVADLENKILVSETLNNVQNNSEVMMHENQFDNSDDGISPSINENHQDIVPNGLSEANELLQENDTRAGSVSPPKSSRSSQEETPMEQYHRDDETVAEDAGQLSSLTDYSKDASDRIQTTESTETNLIDEVGKINVVAEETPGNKTKEAHIGHSQNTDIVIDVQGNKKSPLFTFAPQKKLPVSRVKNITSRLRKDTQSSAQKQCKWYKGKNYVDANSYHWTNMALRSDYQHHLWTDEGAIKETFTK